MSDSLAAPTYVGTEITYRGRGYTVTEEPDMVDRDAGAVEVVNSRGQSNILFVAFKDGHITRAATRHEPWEEVATNMPDRNR